MKRAPFVSYMLAVIIVVAAIVRLVGLSSNPPAISWDEASIGYNAFSILTTGKDEHGRVMPWDTFPAFGDYKPPIPIYLTVPFVALFGLGETAVRFPSALFGVATVGMLYLFVLELLKRPVSKNRTDRTATYVALTSAAVLAVTPWHVMLSRAGFEANIALFFVLLGAWMTLKTRENPLYFLYCWIPFVAGIYTFNSTRYAGPLIAAALLVYVRKEAAAAKRTFWKGAAIALLCLLPITPHLISKESRLRFQEVSIFTDLRTVLTSNTRRSVDGFGAFSAVMHNRRVGYAREYLIHFMDNIEPRFLFVRGDGNPKFSIQDVGQLLLVSAPFVAYGFLALLRDYPGAALLLIWWLIASLAPTAVARETPHALRIENSLPVYMIATAYGLVNFVALMRRNGARVAVSAFAVFLFAGNFAYFWHNLTNHYPKEYSGEWQYGYKQAIALVTRVKPQYDTVVLTESIGRPYIYALFYERFPVRSFWESRDASFDAAGFYNVYGFDKYRFTKEGVDDYKGKTLYILPPKDVPDAARVIETIKLLNGTPILVAFEH